MRYILLTTAVALALTGCTHTRSTGFNGEGSYAEISNSEAQEETKTTRVGHREVEASGLQGRSNSTSRLNAEIITEQSQARRIMALDANPEPPPVRRSGTAKALSVGLWSWGEESLVSVGFHATKVNPGGVGLDFALAFEPRALAGGVALGAMDLGAAYAFSSPGIIVCPKIGFSPIFAAGVGRAYGLIGGYGGVALILAQKVRLDLAVRKVSGWDESLISASIGIGWGLNRE